jgi:hypothetical protein
MADEDGLSDADISALTDEELLRLYTAVMGEMMARHNAAHPERWGPPRTTVIASSDPRPQHSLRRLPAGTRGALSIGTVGFIRCRSSCGRAPLQVAVPVLQHREAAECTIAAPLVVSAAVQSSTLQDVVDNAGEGGGGVNDDPVGGVLSRLMQPLDELALRRPSAKLVRRSLLEPSPQRLKINLKDEDGVEQVDERGEVPGAAAEERRRLVLVGRQGSDLFDAPEMVLVGPSRHLSPGGWITLVGELAVTVDGLVAATLQLIADRRLAGA